MGQWYDRVCSIEVLGRAYRKAKKKGSRPKLGGISWEEVKEDPETFLGAISDELRAGSYHPSRPVDERKRLGYGPNPDRLFMYHVLGIRERIVEYAIKEILLTLCERVFLPPSCAYRPGGEKRFIALVQESVEAGYLWFVSVDIKSFFYSIDTSILKEDLLSLTEDQELVSLVQKSLFFEDHGHRGLIPGHVLSPLLSNLFLHLIDLQLYESKMKKFIRYADNYFFPRKEGARDKDILVTLVETLLRTRNLSLNSEKTKILFNPAPETLLNSKGKSL